MKLSSNISCNDNIMNLLTKETISLINHVAKDLATDDVSLFVQIIDLNNLHAALALPYSPILPGGNTDASLIAFREWVINGACKVNIDCHFPQVSSDYSLEFHNLTGGEAISITTGQWLNARWDIAIEDNNLVFAKVFWMEGTGQGSATLSIASNIFESP